MESKLSNILLIGNGFDLAHGLKTSYNDFLFLMKNWDEFISQYHKLMSNESYRCGTEGIINYLAGLGKKKSRNIERLGVIIKGNTWAKYFINCGAEIDGWIDFEREMYPVLNLFVNIINSPYVVAGHGGDEAEIVIDNRRIVPKLRNKCELLKKYCKVESGNIYVLEKYGHMKYGLLKKKMLNDLKAELNEFIEALELYMIEFADYQKEDIKPLYQLVNIKLSDGELQSGATAN